MSVAGIGPLDVAYEDGIGQMIMMIIHMGLSSMAMPWTGTVMNMKF